MQRQDHQHHGLTLLEVLLILILLAIIAALILPHLGHSSRPLLTEDQSQIRQIQQALVVYSNESEEQHYPVPSELWSVYQPDDPLAASLDTTAHLYSMLIAQNYFGTKIIVGPTETSHNVQLMATYNYEAYNPIGEDPSLWDYTFAADLTTESNVSYAHPPLAGARLEQQWKNTTSSDIACIGNRGPRDGAMPGTPTYERSNTLGFHGDDDQWIGNICFADNHVEFCESIIHKPTGDNFFGSPTNVDGAVDLDATDVLLAFTRSMRVGEDHVAWPSLQYD